MFNQFIHRPVLSIVLSLILTILGGLAIFQLPVSQFPNIAPPEVTVTAEYTGANAQTSVNALVRTLERAINGVPGMKYMASDAGNDGTSIVSVYFETGTDVNMAAVNVQNEVSEVIGKLPEEVRLSGVKVHKEINSMLMYLNITSSDSTMDEKFIHNFAHINVLEEIKRIKGVGFIDIVGQREYAIRIWLKPDRMTAYNISADEIITALQEQNVEAAPGKVGQSSMKEPLAMQYVLQYTGKFTKEEEYGNIPVKSTSDGKILRLQDLADIEFGTAFYDVRAKLDGQPSAAIIIKQLPGSNAKDVIDRIKEKMKELKEKTFLPGMDYKLSYDVSRFLDASMSRVLTTFIEAFLLVSLVVFLFLQDLRSTLIPAIAVPVSVIGTFFFMQLFGFSINLITLFALVMAIGIVVDNAIVVVEAVHKELEMPGVTTKAATVEAMKKTGGAIIAMTLVMSAVYVPIAFMSGPVGVFYRQFSVTLAISIVISGLCALTLTPALCVLLLRRPDHNAKGKTWLNRFLHAFNRGYDSLSDRYRRLIEVIVNRRTVTFGILIIFSVASWGLGSVLPTGFIPGEDMGTLTASVLTPPGATTERTQVVVDEVQQIANGLDVVESVSSLAGTNIFSDGTGAPFGTVLINFKEWKNRKESVDEIAALLADKTSHIREAEIEFIQPPPVPGYGHGGGFELRLLDKTGSDDLGKMQVVLDEFLVELRKRPEIQSAFTLFENNYPQYVLHIDYDKAAQKGVSVNTAMRTLQTFIGSEWASDFIRYGKMFRVMVQAHPKYRAAPEDILKLHVKNDAGDMVPYSAFMELERTLGPEQITRYNMYTSAEINGEPAPGHSTGSALKAIQEVAKEKLFPHGYDIAWAGMTYDQMATGNQAMYVFLVCLVFVYLILAAQYESFLLPLPVIFSLPVGVFGALLLLMLFNFENNIYAQVAMIMLIGMLGKNAILIVEYAKEKQQQGFTAWQAATEGAVLRLRPILMTSFAFTAGLLPLMFATGAGAVGTRTIGTAGAGGMIFGTALGVIVIPGLYCIFASWKEKKMTAKYQTTPAKEAIQIN